MLEYVILGFAGYGIIKLAETLNENTPRLVNREIRRGAQQVSIINRYEIKIDNRQYHNHFHDKRTFIDNSINNSDIKILKLTNSTIDMSHRISNSFNRTSLDLDISENLSYLYSRDDHSINHQITSNLKYFKDNDIQLNIGLDGKKGNHSIDAWMPDDLLKNKRLLKK